jgi:methionine-rich copper-binding protein CopC
MQPMRRLAPLLLAGSLVLLPTLALGHTELAASDPADGSTVTEPPDEVVLTFEGEVGEGSSFGVIGPDGEAAGQGELDLEVADRNTLRGEVTVTEPGAYRVVWSVVGEDEHPVEGEVTFTYDPEGEVPAPNTALPAGTGSPATLIGALLVVLAVSIPVRRALAVRG